MNKIIAEALLLEQTETDKFGGLELFTIARKKGMELADRLGADRDIVTLGTIFMDIKLGECLQENKLGEHISRSAAAAERFLQPFNIDGTVLKKVVGCVESHHGTKPYDCLEAEICANADCYKFLTPRGIFIYLTMLGGRGQDISSCLDQLEYKMDEKYKTLSLEVCKNELIDFYQKFKELIKTAR